MTYKDAEKIAEQISIKKDRIQHFSVRRNNSIYDASHIKDMCVEKPGVSAYTDSMQAMQQALNP